MSKLDDLKLIDRIDKDRMLALLVGLPAQFEHAADIGRHVKFSARKFKKVSNVVFSGLGGSAIGGDIVKSYIEGEAGIPIIVNRDYTVPAFTRANTLFFASSYSGNTEETISAYKEARKRKAKVIVITTGGALGSMAGKDGSPVVKIPSGMPPRYAIGYSFITGLWLMSRIGLVSDKSRQLKEAVGVMQALRDKTLGPDIPASKNLAKKIAISLFDKYCIVYGADRYSGCIAARWRSQFAENSKALASSNVFPEMNHNEIMGYSHPGVILKKTVAIFLKNKKDHPRVRLRMDITRSLLKNRISGIIEVNSAGKGLLAEMSSLLYIGDFASFYLAILNNENPSLIEDIERLKTRLGGQR
ncbi:MAG: bifunctional phosphoglucose/phosphomannose isomerase [Candidatus Omnitrophota bacterium]